MLSKDFLIRYVKTENDLELLTCSQLRFYLRNLGFGCYAGSNVRKSQLLFNAKEIFNKYGLGF